MYAAILGVADLIGVDGNAGLFQCTRVGSGLIISSIYRYDVACSKRN